MSAAGVSRKFAGSKGYGFLPRPAPPLAIWIPALAVAGAIALPIVYLALRAADADPSDVWSLMTRQRTWETAGR
ncbi:MAG: iron ABC transporter permease, partial [Dehalococcoidia bacterium]|nr:iron ABC transporter permease [Dehalococcoidia bacterium]